MSATFAISGRIPNFRPPLVVQNTDNTDDFKQLVSANKKMTSQMSTISTQIFSFSKNFTTLVTRVKTLQKQLMQNTERIKTIEDNMQKNVKFDLSESENEIDSKNNEDSK